VKKIFFKWLRSSRVWRNMAAYVVSEITYFAAAGAFCIGALYILSPVLNLLSPIVTALFVLCGTAQTLERSRTGVLSVTGIILYIMCWPISTYRSELLGQIVCFVGIMTWILSLGLSLTPENKKRQLV
jgi:hypothetical protein